MPLAQSTHLAQMRPPSLAVSLGAVSVWGEKTFTSPSQKSPHLGRCLAKDEILSEAKCKLA
ncbi:hypothetical protein HAL013_05280 [Helicobacter ailurogastricus]|uniref:Uncharacterized protein n=1 Tax=Helicobacter ailurogastricus TaxID=1578720 RepID=A0A0K2X3W6_9HELI|nr:hypothetical protein HAL011_07430 [Helicobacter ailurogastricus]CRF42358.1 hypothetical protein HAL013_05280 [Helicobacter ailurogastricus]CRF44613.1 hypothetical protein HAL09_12070 [Helicobacter ailurogastricus]